MFNELSIKYRSWRHEQLSLQLKKVRAIFRISGVILTLSYYVAGLVFKKALFGDNLQRGFKARLKFTSTTMKIIGVKLKTEGKPIEGPALYVSNHRSMLDPIIQLNSIEAFIVSKAEVDSYPIIGPGVRSTGVIFVSRGEHTSRSAAKEAIRQTLVDGHPVLIYPEGTTSKIHTTQDFKPGSFKVAYEEGIPVVPVAIDYRDESHKWEDGGLLSFVMHKFSSKRIDTAMHIGDPVVGASALEVMKLSQAWIHDELIRMHGSW